MQLTAACTTYYPTSQLSKGLHKATTHNDEVVAQALSDYQQKRSIYDTLILKTSDPNMPPYPEFSQRLKGLHEKLEQLERQHRVLEEIQQRFHENFNGIERIKQGSENWQKLLTLQSEYNRATEAMEQSAKVYQSTSNELASLLNRHHVNRVNPSLLKQKLNSYLTQLDSSIETTEEQLNDYRQQLKDYHRKADATQVNNVRDKTVEELEKILNQIEHHRDNISQFHSHFDKDLSNGEKQWVGPGMASHRLLEKITAEGNAIESLQSEFVESSRKLCERC